MAYPRIAATRFPGPCRPRRHHSGRRRSFAAATRAATAALLLALVESTDAALVDGELDLTRLQYNNLRGTGPMTNVEESLRFQEVIEVDGAKVDLVVSTDGDYHPIDPSKNGAHPDQENVGVINLEVGTRTDLLFRFFEAGTTNPKAVPSFFFSVFDLGRCGGGEREERMVIKGFGSVYLTTETRLEYEHQTAGTAFRARSKVAVHLSDALLLSKVQRAHTATFRFAHTEAFRLSAWCTGQPQPGLGWDFLFGSAANAPSYASALPLSFLEAGGPGWQSNTDWLARLHGTDDVDLGSNITNTTQLTAFRVPDPTTCSCSLDFTNVTQSNLGGLGPDKSGGALIRYSNVCNFNGRYVDLVLEADGGYESTDVRSNGRSPCGPYGSMSVKFGTIARLQARFLDAKTDQRVRVKDFFFTVFDLDMFGSHEEKVTISGFDKEFTTEDTMVTQEEVLGGDVFTSPTISTGVSCPSDPLALTGEQANVAISVLFKDVQEFSFSFEVLGPSSEKSHNFIFGGASTINMDCAGHGLPTTTLTTSTTTATTTTRTTTTETTTTTATNTTTTSTATTQTTTTTYDCESAHSHKLWSKDMEAYCCEKYDKFCITTTSQTHTLTSTTTVTSEPYNCSRGLPVEWSENQTSWCCNHYNKGCTTTLTTSSTRTSTSTTSTSLEPFTCENEPSKWSTEKRAWCCNNHHKGCSLDGAAGTTTAPHGGSSTTLSATTPHPYSGCGKPVSCELRMDSVVHDNLAGKGPDMTEPHNLRFGNVCFCAGGAVDLVITTEGPYATASAQDNGKSSRGPYGAINVKLGSTVNLKAHFVHAGTDTPVKVESFFFSVFGLYQQSPEHKEIVTARSFDSYYLSAGTRITHEQIVNGAVFKSTGVGATPALAPNPLNCAVAQEQTAVAMLFREVSEFPLTLTVAGELVDEGRDFFFGGRSCITEHCSTTTAQPGGTSPLTTMPAKATTLAPVTSNPAGENIDCEHGDSNLWPPQQKHWCCEKRNIACPDPYDCNAGYAAWQTSWSAEQKAWCCQHKHRACAKPPPAGPPYDCAAGGLPAQAQWTQVVRRWCCQNRHLGCPTTAPPAENYDCLAGFANWRAGWSIPKKEYCCKHKQRGCLFDCDVAYYNWKAAWSDDKKQWCCKNEHRGCGTGQGLPTSEPYDCHAGAEHWDLGWASSKKDWCCRNKHVGCGTTAAPATGFKGEPFNCAAGFNTWQTSWSHPKKQWCCNNYARACAGTTPEPFDCATDFATWRTSWHHEKRVWCCHAYNRGCTSFVRRFETLPRAAVGFVRRSWALTVPVAATAAMLALGLHIGRGMRVCRWLLRILGVRVRRLDGQGYRSLALGSAALESGALSSEGLE